GLRIAIAPSINGIQVAREIRDALKAFGARLSAEGAAVEECEPLPFQELLSAFRRAILPSLALFARAGLAPPGSAAALDLPEPSSPDVMAVLDERDRFIANLDRFFAESDAFICPAATVVAFTHRAHGDPIEVDGELVPSICVDHPTMLSTYTGSPSLVVPIA